MSRMSLFSLLFVMSILSGCVSGINFGKGPHGEYKASGFACVNPPDVHASVAGIKACGRFEADAFVLPEAYPVERL